MYLIAGIPSYINMSYLSNECVNVMLWYRSNGQIFSVDQQKRIIAAMLSS